MDVLRRFVGFAILWFWLVLKCFKMELSLWKNCDLKFKILRMMVVLDLICELWGFWVLLRRMIWFGSMRFLIGLDWWFEISYFIDLDIWYFLLVWMGNLRFLISSNWWFEILVLVCNFIGFYELLLTCELKIFTRWFMDFLIVIDSRDEEFYELVSYCMDLKKRFMKWFLYCDWFWNDFMIFIIEL